MHHAVHISPHTNQRSASWSFDGDEERPTFRPSLLWEIKEGDPEKVVYRCHSFISQGKIQYLMDSTHSMRGMTVEIPDLERE